MRMIGLFVIGLSLTQFGMGQGVVNVAGLNDYYVTLGTTRVGPAPATPCGSSGPLTLPTSGPVQFNVDTPGPGILVVMQVNLTFPCVPCAFPLPPAVGPYVGVPFGGVCGTNNAIEIGPGALNLFSGTTGSIAGSPGRYASPPLTLPAGLGIMGSTQAFFFDPASQTPFSLVTTESWDFIIP